MGIACSPTYGNFILKAFKVLYYLFPKINKKIMFRIYHYMKISAYARISHIPLRWQNLIWQVDISFKTKINYLHLFGNYCIFAVIKSIKKF